MYITLILPSLTSIYQRSSGIQSDFRFLSQFLNLIRFRLYMTCLPNFAFYAFTAFLISLAAFNSARWKFLEPALSTNSFLLPQLNPFLYSPRIWFIFYHSWYFIFSEYYIYIFINIHYLCLHICFKYLAWLFLALFQLKSMTNLAIKILYGFIIFLMP